MVIEIKKCTREDLAALQEVGTETFYETFKSENTRENMETYLENAFTINQLKKEFSNAHSEFYFIYDHGEIAGYLKVNVEDAQTEEMGSDSLEIERIYVKKKFQRRGFGEKLYNKAIKIAKEQNKNKVWLGVWEKSVNAILFYEKLGFIQKDAHVLQVGDEAQTDFIMTKMLV